MSTALALNNILQVRFCCSLGDQVAFNVRHYIISAIAGTITDQEMADAIDAVCGGSYRNVLCDTATYRGLDLQILNSSGPNPIPVIATGQSGLGFNVADPLPRQTCGLISLRTPFAGRAFRGRAYIPFPSEASNTTGGLPGAAYMTDLTTLAGVLASIVPAINGASTANASPVVKQTGSNVVSLITTTIPRPMWATQRRRGSFGRPNLPPF